MLPGLPLSLNPAKQKSVLEIVQLHKKWGKHRPETSLILFTVGVCRQRFLIRQYSAPGSDDLLLQALLMFQSMNQSCTGYILNCIFWYNIVTLFGAESCKLS